MAHDPLTGISTRATPQSQPVPGRTDMVPNAAGGFVFKADDWARLRRFLILGTVGGTFYISERDLTQANAEVVMRLVRSDGLAVVRELRTVSLENLAPKVQPTIFALAVAASTDNVQVRAAAYDALPDICRTGTHLFTFAKYVKQFRGWSRGLRRAVAEWYTDRPLTRVDENGDGDDPVRRSPLDLQLIKYRNREGWTHADMLRLSHPTTSDPRLTAAFRWVLGKSEIGEDLPEIMRAADSVAQLSDPKDIAKLITEFNLPWEAVPSEALRSPVVWEALLPHMGLTALIRNVGRMTNIGMIKPMSVTTKAVTERITNQQALLRSRVHPFAVLLAQTTYAAGRGVRGSLTWSPVKNVVDALDSAFYLAFGNVRPAGKRTMLAVDVSGSMTWGQIANSHITPIVAAGAMTLITNRTEPLTMTTAFSTNLREVPISDRQRLDDVVRTFKQIGMGGTDCAQPMIYAKQRKLEVDTFVVYTDYETWAGRIHPFQALRDYRQSSGIPARLVTVGFVANDSNIADPDDAGMMDVVGFDASAPNVISDFSAGKV